MISENKTPMLSGGKTAAVLLAVLSLVGLTGWAWWNETGPFQLKRPTVEVIDLTADIKYLNPQVRFEGFTKFGFNPPVRWVKGQKKIDQSGFHQPPGWLKGQKNPEVWSYEKIRDVPSFFSDYEDRDDKSTDTARITARQYLTNKLASAIPTMGFQLPPPKNSRSTGVSRTSYANLTAVVKSYRQNHLIIFQVETTLYGEIRADFRKPSLYYTQLSYCTGRVYVVEEKNVMEAIVEGIEESARVAIRGARSHERVSYDAPPRPEMREFAVPED